MAKRTAAEQNNIAGLDEETYNKTATQYAKGAIGIWLVAGIIFNLVTGKLFSISTLMLILPGILIVPFLVIPLFLLSIKKNKSIKIMHDLDEVSKLTFQQRSHAQDVPKMLLWTIVTGIEWVFPGALAVVAMALLHNL